LKAGQFLLYIIGIYLLIMGGLSICVKKKYSSGSGKCCAIIYGISVLPVFVLMCIMSFPILTIYGISEENINQMCAVASRDTSLVAATVTVDPAARLLEADDTTTVREDAEKKMDELKTYSKDKFSDSVKAMYKFIGPIIKSVDTAAATASDSTMCREACPCKPITADGLKTYSKAFIAQAALDEISYTAWKAGNKSTSYDGYRFDGEID